MTSLDERLDAAGARRAEDGRVRSFGAPDAEARALAEGAGLHVRGGLVTLRARGADHVDYLHRMLTQDVAGLPAHGAAAACLLDVRGRILGDLVLWRHPESIDVEMHAGARSAVEPVLERYVIADDVTFEDVSARRARLALVGPGAPAALEAVGLEAPAPGRLAEASMEAAVLHVWRRDLAGTPAFEIALPAEPVAGLVHALLDEAGVRPCGEEGFEAFCIAAGVPRFGHELTADVLFNEAGLESAISWNKGCYPGQEPVVMARHRGHPPRRLVRLALAGDSVPAAGAALLSDGRKAGVLTSAAASPTGSVSGLGYVRHALAEAGVSLAVEGDGSARVLGPVEA